MKNKFKNKKLLITGGTGSFGKSVLKYFISSNINEIRIFSRDEKKQDDMRNELNNNKLKFYIGDVRDTESLINACRGVDYVFHAAALKQVPSCEFYPSEAIKTNIIGTENILDASITCNVKKVVVLSTDKAVYPINAMGMSKAMAEKLLIAKSRFQQKSETTFCITRYGNVMASRGSVIPLFVSQIKKNEPLSITDPQMTRFLMSLQDSVELVVYALLNGKRGDIFVQKSPAATVLDLAKALLDIFNKKNKLNIIGTRHGEKLYETLISREEMARAKDLKKYYRIPADTRDLNYSKYFSVGKKQLNYFKDYTSHNTTRLNVKEIKKMLLNLGILKKGFND
tara:strand:+ start:212 stop:1231 length:1020 start_codon:yes stop_codon:yes gene_type:complete